MALNAGEVNYDERGAASKTMIHLRHFRPVLDLQCKALAGHCPAFLLRSLRTSAIDGAAPWRRIITSPTRPGPAGLVEGAERGAVVAVEILAEDQVVMPGGVGLHPIGPAEAGPPSVRVGGEQRDQPVLEVGGDQVAGG
jgi:hypothetical protein